MTAQPCPYVCRNGHTRTPENTFTDTNGKRKCKDCRADAVRRYQATHPHRGDTAVYALPGDWADDAACRGAVETMTYDLPPSTNAQAKAVCGRCPVIAACRTWALTCPDPAQGMVAGGLTPPERNRVRRTAFNPDAPFFPLVALIDGIRGA